MYIVSYPSDLHNTLLSNTVSCIYLIRSLSRSMIANRFGSILTIGSIIGSQGNVGQLSYSTSKSALEGMTKTYSKELSRYNINVNLLCPGWVEGASEEGEGGGAGMIGKEDPEGGSRADRWHKLREDKQWIGRAGSVDEIANVAMFLVSPAASYIHGQSIHADGGLRL